MWGEIRQAVRELAPVVLAAAGQPRLESFASAIRGRSLVLSPLATDGLPTQLTDVELHCASTTPFVLAGVSLTMGAGRATADVSAARMSRPPSRRGHARLRIDQPRVLVVSGGSQLDAHAFPVLDISAHGCAIETFSPLDVGHRIEAVELWGDRRMLRRCSAVVAESTPWRDATGADRHRARILFSDAAPAPAQRDQVEDPERIRRILELCAFSGPPLRVALPLDDRVLRARLVAAEDDRLRLAFDEAVDAPRLRARFDLYAVSYEMQIRSLSDDHTLSTDDTLIDAAYPLLLQRRRRRYQFRAEVPAGMDVRLQLVNPATGETQRHGVVDLSFGGVAFRTDPARDVLWPGLTLEKLVCRTGSTEIALGEASVISVADGICRVELRTADAVESPEFVDLMARLRFPRLEVSDGSDFEAMVRLYKSVGLFGPHMQRNLEPESRLLVARNWKAMHETPLCRTLVQREGEPVAGVSALRAWENAWVIQHMVAAPNLAHYEPGVLHMSYLDYVLPRPDGKYMIVFVNTDNSRIARFLNSFFALTGTPEAVARTPLHLWIHHGGAPAPEASALTVRPMRRSDHTLIENAAVRTLGKVAAAALALRPEELELPDTRQAFAKHGLVRTRRVRVITDRGTPLLALLEERASPGLNLTWLLNCGWVLPLCDDVHPDALKRAALELASAPTDTTTGDRFMLIPDGLDTTAFAEAGFQFEAGVDLYAYNRTGLHRWYYFLREHYGKRAILAARELHRVMDAS